MSEESFSKEEYMRAFRQRLFESEAFHQALAVMLAKDRAAQNLQMGRYNRQKSRSMLKRLSAHVTNWIRQQRQTELYEHMNSRVSQNEAPLTIDAIYVVIDDGTISESTVLPRGKEHNQ